MPKSKKRKGAVKNNPASLQSLVKTNKDYSDKFHLTARKYMQLIGLEPDTFDKLPKRMREKLMQIKFSPTRIDVEEGFKIPKKYVELFQRLLITLMQVHTYGDPRFGIKYIDFMTFGQALFIGLRNISNEGALFPQEHIELARTISDKMIAYEDAAENEEHHCSIKLPRLICQLLQSLTKINYRYYTCKLEWKAISDGLRMQSFLTFSSIEAERKHIKIDGRSRTAFQLGCYLIEPEPEWALMPVELILKDKRGFLPIFIQQHALIRLGERLHPQVNFYINKVLAATFFGIDGIKIIDAITGQSLICAFDSDKNLVGYFPFIQIDECILLTSFLPLSSPITPQGSVLNKLLGMSIEDNAYLQMDKLSFYLQTDFDVLPTLKKALKEAEMWHLTKIIPANMESATGFTKKTSQMMTKIFEQKE